MVKVRAVEADTSRAGRCPIMLSLEEEEAVEEEEVEEEEEEGEGEEVEEGEDAKVVGLFGPSRGNEVGRCESDSCLCTVPSLLASGRVREQIG